MVLAIWWAVSLVGRFGGDTLRLDWWAWCFFVRFPWLRAAWCNFRCFQIWKVTRCVGRVLMPPRTPLARTEQVVGQMKESLDPGQREFSVPATQ